MPCGLRCDCGLALSPRVDVLGKDCNAPVIFCSGDMFLGGRTHERSDGRRDQALDGAEEVGTAITGGHAPFKQALSRLYLGAADRPYAAGPSGVP